MNIKALADSISKLECALSLKRKIVGVNFLFTEDEFALADAQALQSPIHYCVMVKSAASGHSLKASAENFGCPGSARALGIIQPDETFRSGRHYQRLGLYQDLAIAKNARNHMTFCQHTLYGVMVKPLAESTSPPDVVLMVADAYQGMRIIQGYTYMYGIHPSYKLSGNQALCSECTAYPFESGHINLSLLCGGTRNAAGWRDDELAIGFPFHRFSSIAEGVYQTVNTMEPDRNKEEIEKKLNIHQRTDLSIEYGNAYFLRNKTK